MHKCQGTSQLLMLPAPRPVRTYRLKDSVIGEPGVAPRDLFDGIDTSLAGLAKYAGAQPPANLVMALQAIAAAVEQAKQAAEARGPTAAAVPLTQGLASLRSLRAAVAAQSASSSALQLSPDADTKSTFVWRRKSHSSRKRCC